MKAKMIILLVIVYLIGWGIISITYQERLKIRDERIQHLELQLRLEKLEELRSI